MDIIVFPGGVGTRALMQDERVLDWVRTAHETTAFTTSVCTGSLVLGAAGLLFDRTAAEASQLMIEYDPQPPFDAGAIRKVSDEVMTRVVEYAAVRS